MTPNCPRNPLDRLPDLPLAIDRFEAAWRAGQRPKIADFLDNPARRALDLPRLVAIDLEHRLQAHESAHVENYLASECYPELFNDREQLIELIAGEYMTRRRLGTAKIDDFLSRFPRLDGLRQRLESIPVDVAQTLVIPLVFGRYRLGDWLGCGALGSVYVAEDQVLERPVAIKFHKPHPLLHDHSRYEAIALARVHHPGVCPVFDCGRVNELSYLVMPYIRNARSLTIAFKPPLPAAEAARLMAGIARAVHAVHEAGVLHRDLKPGNILVDVNNHPLVCDFGLARYVRADDAHDALRGMLVGSPAYMSPEQARGVSLGPSSDLYSLAVMLFELLTNRLPETGSVVEVISRTARRQTSLRELLPPHIDSSLAAILERATQVHPADRYPSVADFAEALERWWSQPAGAVLRGSRESGTSPDITVELLALIREFGWEEGLRRARQNVQREPEPVRRSLAESVIFRLTEEQPDRGADVASRQSPETGSLGGWWWTRQALRPLAERDFPALRECLQHASESAGDDRMLLATVAHLRGAAAHHQGYPVTAWSELCQALERFGPNHFLTARVMDTLGMVAVSRSQWPAAREFYAAALALKKQHGDTWGEALTRGQLGRLSLDLGDTDQADHHFREGRKLCRRIGDARGLAQQTNHQGQVLLALGQPDRASRILDEAVSLAAGRFTIVEGFARKDRAEAWIELGRLAEASQECAEAADRFARTDFREGLAHVRRVRGVCLVRQGDVDGGMHELREAASFFEDAGEDAEAARCLWRLARLLREVPDREANADGTFAAAWELAARSRRTRLAAAIEREWGKAGWSWSADQGELAPFAARTVVGAVAAVQLSISESVTEDPEVEWEWHSHLQADLEFVADRHDGTVVEVHGDGFLLLFRGPDCSRRSLLAALAIDDWLRAFNRPRQVMRWPLWQARIGLASGPLWLGRTGRFSRNEWAAGGTTVRHALALRDAAEANVPCCDDSTRQGIDELVFRPRLGGWDVFSTTVWAQADAPST
jgi:tetratricopeptide (TPR) repeat protein